MRPVSTTDRPDIRVRGATVPDSSVTYDVAPRAIDDAPPLENAARERQPEAEAETGQVALGKRFGDWRTWLSFAVALGILVLAVTKAGIRWDLALRAIGHANPAWFALAFAVYYATFPLRGLRWRVLLHNANEDNPALRGAVDRASLWSLTRIVYLSYFANAVVPAKLGDIYRAYLARRELGVSLSRTVGTILAERILDLVVLFPLLALAAVLTFRERLFSAHDPTIRAALLIGLGLAVAATAVLVIVWLAHEGVLRLLPRRFHDIYVHFRHGALRSFGRDTPLLAGQTVTVWLLEGARFACILAALGLLSPLNGGRGVGLDAALFLALGSTVLTTLPLTPAGLGLVEPFIFTVLALLAVPGGVTTGAAVAVLERIVSYLSIAVFGFALYIISNRARPARTRAAATSARERIA